MSAAAESELDRLNRTYRPALLAYFLRRVRDHAEAEDLTQDVFVRLARTDRSEIRSADAFIFQIAANLLRDRARREKHRFAYRGALAADEQLGIDPLDPSRILGGRESLSALADALCDLPELTRQVFICHRLENIPRLDVAQAFQISEWAVDRHLAKAMAHLIQRLREL